MADLYTVFMSSRKGHAFPEHSSFFVQLRGKKKMLPCFYSDAEIMCNLKVVHQQLFLHEEHGAFRALENTGSKLFGTLTEVLK